MSAQLSGTKKRHSTPGEAGAPLVQLRAVYKAFPLQQRLLGRSRHWVYAVNGVDLQLTPGRTVGLVGESGSGKSTVGKLICRLELPDSGQVLYDGQDVTRFRGAALRAYHRQVQMVFQNPYAALNPRKRVDSMLREVLKVHRLAGRSQMEERLVQLLEQVGLPAESRHRFPFEFSGGQRQRLCIARALAVEPRVLVCDEPVSALDVSIQAQILHLLKTIQQKNQLAMLFISHDLSVVYHMCNEVLIMYLGKIVERGAAERIFSQPLHPYTRALLSAIPVAEPGRKRERIVLHGEIPSATRRPPGCPFYSRCPQRLPHCQTEFPPAHSPQTGHTVWCWLYREGHQPIRMDQS